MLFDTDSMSINWVSCGMFSLLLQLLQNLTPMLASSMSLSAVPGPGQDFFYCTSTLVHLGPIVTAISTVLRAVSIRARPDSLKLEGIGNVETSIMHIMPCYSVIIQEPRPAGGI